MGLMQRQKGQRREREFAELVGGKRVPLSGAAEGYPGDVTGLGLTWECKARAAGFRQLYKWLDGKDALALKADRQEWLVVLPLETLRSLLERGRSEGRSRPGGRPRLKVPVKNIIDAASAGLTVTQIAREHGVSRGTVYNIIREGRDG